MDDLIYRQVAIDAMGKPPKFKISLRKSYEEGRNDQWFDDVSALSRVPTARADSTIINKFIDRLEEIFADIREANVDDSVCGLCEFDGAYIGESGDWCNECPGFNRDDCFKLRDGIREKWIAEITNALPPAQQWIPCSERLPKVGQDILMSVGGMYTAEGCLREDGDWAQFRWDAIQRKDMVVAWMPLPKPYAERRTDEAD